MVSFASPCTIALVPGYLAYMTGLSGEELDNPTAGNRSRMGLPRVWLTRVVSFTLLV